MNIVPENDRLFVWMLVKNLDHPRFKTVALLDDLGIEIYDRDSEYPYVRRSDFRNLLYSVAENN